MRLLYINYWIIVLALMLATSACAHEKYKVFWCELTECRYMHQFITLDVVDGTLNVQVDADDKWSGMTLIGLGGKILSVTTSDSITSYLIANRDGGESSYNAYGNFGVYRYNAYSNGMYFMLLARRAADALTFDETVVNKTTNPCE